MRRLNPNREDYAMHAANLMDLIASLGRPFPPRPEMSMRSVTIPGATNLTVKDHSQRLAMENKAEEDRLAALLEYQREAHRQSLQEVRDYVEMYIDFTGADEGYDGEPFDV